MIDDQETKRLVQEFLDSKKITKCPPAHASGNEAGKGTRITCTEARREFRRKVSAEKREEKEKERNNLILKTLEKLRKNT